MLEGQVQQQGRPVDLYESPRNRRVADFVGDANLLTGEASGRTVRTAVGDLPLRADCSGDCAVLVRPEQLRVGEGVGLWVERVEYYGHDAVYVLRDDAGEQVRARILERPTFHSGDRVSVRYTGGPTVAYPAA
jgi:iron(III) transport system ATP-binding protein